MTLTDRLTRASTTSDAGATTATGPASAADAAFDVFLDWAGEQGLTLYPAQEEAVLALAGGAHGVLATPTGPGRALVAVAAPAPARCTPA